jgi:hypothetical protein
VVEGRNTQKVLVGNPEGKRSHGGPRHGWEDNIKIDFKNYRREEFGVDLARLECGPISNAVTNLRVP